MKKCKTCTLNDKPCEHRKHYGIFGRTIGCEDFWKPKPSEKILKALEEEATAVHKSFSSTEEMNKDFDARIAKEKKERPFYYYGTRFYYRWIERPVEAVYYFIVDEIPHLLKYGYSRKDIWSLQYTTAKFILPRLRELRKYQDEPYGTTPTTYVPDGVELDYNSPTEAQWKEYHEQWVRDLDKIIRAFELCIENDDEWEDTMDANKEKEAQYEEGIQLFAKHYRDLLT